MRRRHLQACYLVSVALGSVTTGGCAGVSGTVRELKEVGRIRVPSRLETWIEDRNTRRLRFAFHRYYPWYRLDAMGSNTPLREELFVQISNPEAKPGPDLEEWAPSSAAHKVEPLNWRQDGAFRVAEGRYTVNMLETPVVVIALRLPERHVAIGYRAWKKDASLQEAKRTVDEVARSLELSAPLSDLFHSEQSRPEREYRELVARIQTALASYGVSMPALGETRVEKEFLMEFVKVNDEELFTIVRKLGQIRTPHPLTSADSTWLFDYPHPERPLWLFRCGWYVFVNGKWESSKNEPELSENLANRLVASFSDRESSYFYSAERVWFRRKQIFPLDRFLKLIPETEKRLREGKLVKPK